MDESTSVEEDREYEEDLSIIENIRSDDVNDESELEIKNKSIKLDVWLRNCFDDNFLENFLRYKSFKDFTDKEVGCVKCILNLITLPKIIKKITFDNIFTSNNFQCFISTY